MEHYIERINMYRMRKVSRGAGFSWFNCNVFEEKSDKFWCEMWDVEEEFVYLRREGGSGVAA